MSFMRTNKDEESKSVLSAEQIAKYYALIQATDLSRREEKVDIKAIEMLLTKHCKTFAFSTWTAHLADRLIELNPASLATHLLEGDNSGLCFHHNVTLCEVLKSAKLNARLVACQFTRPDNKDALYPIATHVAIVLTIADREYLVDPGYGFGITQVIPMADVKEEKPGRYKTKHIADDIFCLQEIVSDTQDKLHYTFNRAAVSLESFNDCLSTFSRADKVSSGSLVEQGHLFFSLYFRSKLNAENKLEATSVFVKSNGNTAYTGEISEFTKRMLESKHFHHPRLKAACMATFFKPHYEGETPRALLPTSCQNISLRR